jgi:hypothetical protein
MESFSKKIISLIQHKINEQEDDLNKELLNDIIDEINKKIKDEEFQVNRSYEMGYIDAISKRGRNSNFYKTTYGALDFLKQMIKNKYDTEN